MAIIRNPNWRSSRVPPATDEDGVIVDFMIETPGPSMTREEFAAECDINTIMKKYAVTGVVGHVNPVQPRFIDAVGVPDLMTALNTMSDAQQAFMQLPAVVRREFDNDAMEFVKFASESENLPKLRQWGLAAPEKAPDAPMRVEVVNPPSPVESGGKAS